MAKKIFIVSAILFIIISSVLAAQHFLMPEKGIFSTKSPVESADIPEENDQQDSGLVGETVQARMKKIVETGVKGMTFSADASRVLYYQNGNFLSMTLDGATRNSIGAYPFQDVIDMTWSADRKQVLVWTKSGFYVYSLDTDQIQQLKEGIDFATWGKKNGEVLYKFYDKATNTRSLYQANLSGEQEKKLKEINYRRIDFQINSATGEIGYFPSPDSFTLGELVSLGNDEASEKKIFEGKYGADFLWSPNGKKLLVSFVMDKGGRRMELGVANQNGGESKTLDIPTTVQKCVWSKDNVTVYCAMFGPKNGSTDAIVLPNDWYSRKLQQEDTFWRINTQNGKKDRVLEHQDISEMVDCEELALDPEEKYLYCTDCTSGGLYRIQL